MDINQRINQVAENYRIQGYKIVVHPGPEDLPDFAKDFKVEIVARREDVSALVSVKWGASALQSDPNLVTYAEITENQADWRYDLVFLGSGVQPVADLRDAKELSEEEIQRSFEEVERLLQAGFVHQALVAAWAILESAMRRKLQADGEDADWATSPRTMLNELYSSGILYVSEFRELESIFQVRSAIVHGFAPPVIEHSAVEFLVETARRLLTESQVSAKAV